MKRAGIVLRLEEKLRDGWDTKGGVRIHRIRGSQSQMQQHGGWQEQVAPALRQLATHMSMGYASLLTQIQGLQCQQGGANLRLEAKMAAIAHSQQRIVTQLTQLQSDYQRNFAQVKAGMRMLASAADDLARGMDRVVIGVQDVKQSATDIAQLQAQQKEIFEAHTAALGRTLDDVALAPKVDVVGSWADHLPPSKLANMGNNPKNLDTVSEAVQLGAKKMLGEGNDHFTTLHDQLSRSYGDRGGGHWGEKDQTIELSGKDENGKGYIAAIALRSQALRAKRSPVMWDGGAFYKQVLSKSERARTSTKEVRAYLRKVRDDGRWEAFVANMGYSGYTYADLEVDHGIPKSIGGSDSIFNFTVMPASTNKHFSGWWTPEKATYLGKATVMMMAAAVSVDKALSGMVTAADKAAAV